MAPQEQDMGYPPGKEDSTSPSGDSTRSLDSLVAQQSSGETESSTDVDVLAEILAGVYRVEGMAAQGFAALRERLAVIEARLGISAESGEQQVVISDRQDNDAPDAEQALQGQVVAEIVIDETSLEESSDSETAAELPPTATPVAQPAASEEQLPPTAQPITRSPQQVPQPVQPVRDVYPVAAPTTGGELAALVFGQDFAYHESLISERQALLAAMRGGQEDAVGLAGQILTIRAATMDRLPTLLKDVGEAWYRWRGDDGGVPDPLRDALIAWLHTRLEAVGLGNRIELVRVGDRYDSKRHNAKARGVEVVGVQGWVVLRDNGNVYTKANVTVA